MSFPSYSRTSLWGLYQYDENILSTLVLPNSFSNDEKETIKDNILIESAELELYYTDPSFLKVAIQVWSKKQCPVWEKLKDALDMEYNPIENYDRLEHWEDSSSGISETSGSHEMNGTSRNVLNDVTQSAGTDTGTVSNAGSREYDISDSDRNTIDETVERDLGEETNETNSNTETRNLAHSATGHIETESSSSNSTTDSKNIDSETLNKVMGANLSEGWADHDKSIVDGLEQGSSSSTGTGTSETDNTDSSTDTGTIGNSGTGTKTVSTDDDTTRNVLEVKTHSSDYDESNSNTETRNLANSDRTQKDATNNGTTSETGTTSGTTENETSSEHDGRTHGNIGVTTSQQMLESEILLRKKYYIMDIIINDFISKFCLRVY